MNFQRSLKQVFALLIFVFGAVTAYSQTNRILNNDRLRLGNGNEHSINSAGNMQQPFYYNGSEYRKLTYSSYPLDIRWGIGGDGTNSWNTSGTIIENPSFSNQTYDFSGFTITNNTTGDGYGQIRTAGQITVNGQLFRIENTYELLRPEGYIAIKVKITNISAAPASNVRLWVGTRDDFVGGTDQPKKERGNLVSQEFELITNAAEQAKAIKISTSEEAILFFSNSDRAYSTIQRCCSFSNATNENPATNIITATNDGSYALYVRFNDLDVNESDELIWYYGAGTLPEIDEIIRRVANAAIGAFDNITYQSADYTATTTVDGAGYWILVPEGSTPPMEAQIKAGSDYNGVAIVGSGSTAMMADQEQVFNIAGLEGLTTYDFYFVSEYFDGESNTYTEVIDETFTTLEAPPVLTDINPKTAAFGETITLTGSNFITTSNVKIGGLDATFSIIDQNTLQVVVPEGAEEFFIIVTNESGSTPLESEVGSNTEAPCTTGWNNAWQTITTQGSGNLSTVTLKLENTHGSNAYDLFLELHEVDNEPSSPDPNIKFNSLKATSEILTVSANTAAGEATFIFNSNNQLLQDTNYYLVLKESITNPVGTGEQRIYKTCMPSTDGASGNLFGTLYYSFTMSPILEISNPPTAIALSPDSIEENNEVNATVGTLTSIDADTVDTHSYAFVVGTGDTDNGVFSLSGADLLANESFDYEMKSNYSIRISSTDSDSNVFEETITITIRDNTDEDGDGVLDAEDNCPTIANADQLDTDSDGYGNICDDDDDGDGTPDDEDDFPLDPTEDTDTDGDGIGDNTDPDIDGDGTPNDDDDFPYDPTEDTDTDGDGIGDNTDPDIDGDGTPNDDDDFPYDPTEDTDTDGDGIGDNEDEDDDNDGTPDSEDDFPYDPSEDTDTDGDGVGDNTDPDIDGDGTPNDDDDFPYDPTEDTDTDGDGIGDNTDPDIDGDGTPNDEDYFPYDPTEDTDTDGDGLGDNTDPDIDGDGTPNDEDYFPYDPTEDTDTDGDGLGDNTDPDIDGDGTPNDEDDFPYDPTEDTDTDGDGIGDNTDPDIDGDGTPNDEDDFPYDPSEDTDTDGDGVGDNTDPDIDGDGTPNDEDDFPYDPTEDTDTDGDGIGDNSDTDDDNDGIPDDEDYFPTNDRPSLIPAEAFTPNGDGINDHWMIPGIENYPNALVTVYNRWGHEVFASKGYRNGWDATYKSNRSKLPSGSYLYVIDMGNGSAPIKGWLFINY